MSPELAREQLQTLVQQAIADEYEGSESLRLRCNLPVDLTNLTELLAVMNPVRGMSEFLYINPRIPLRSLMSVNPLRALTCCAHRDITCRVYDKLTTKRLFDITDEIIGIL